MKKKIIPLLCLFIILGLASCAKKKQVSINSVDDLKGLTVGCQAGTTGELFLTDEIENVNVKSFKTGIDAALSLKNGAVDAVVIDELPAKEIVKRNSDLKTLDIKFFNDEYAIAVRKGDSDLLSSINNTIASMRANGTYENLVNAFMPLDGNIVLPEDVVTNFTTVIKMGTNAAFPPFEYTEGTKIVGFDASMAQLIARDCERKLEIVDMNFDGLIAALQSGAIDFIAAGMSATDERRKNVDFSEPYYTSNQVIIVRK